MQDAPLYIKDTIVAAATPAGVGGVSVVRISGPEAERIAALMLGTLPEPRRAELRRFTDGNGTQLDVGIALLFPRPNSYTGETVVELQGHGGPMVVAGIVDAVVALGARNAEPGEFSKRAFLNGKLDLAQAEAIADLIGSGTRQAARAALRSLSGAFSRAVESLQEQLTTLRLHVEAAIDFPEDEIDFLTDDALHARIESARASFQELARTAEAGRVLRDGFRVVIIGRPNAGKSSLLNLLSGQEAAIVTEIAGTTRDILREQISIDGLAVELVDTAGLREDPDQVEAEGIRRARDAMRHADAVLQVQDATEPAPGAQGEQIPDDIPVIVVRNKIDLCGEQPGTEKTATGTRVRVSALTGAGVDELRATIGELAGYRDLGEGAFTARRRQLDALARSRTHFDLGCRALFDTRSGELLAEELRLAQRALGEITGELTSDDLLGRIFGEFCIGK